ncbi:unnamed protein product, partial [Rotaria sordida]
MLKRCTSLFSHTLKNNEEAYEFYRSLIDLIEFRDFLTGSNEKLSEIDTICRDLLNNLREPNHRQKIDKILCDLRETISSDSSEETRQIKYLIDQFSSNIEKVINYLNEKIKIINEQEKKNISLKISDELFSEIENLDDDIRILIVEKLYHNISVEELNFCLSMHKIHQRLGEKLKIYLSQNISIKDSLQKELESFFKRHRQDKTSEEILSNLALPFIDILNLYECNLNDKIKATIEDLKDIQNEKMLRELKEQVLINLITSYPVLDKELEAIKTYINKVGSSEEKQTENYEIVLAFLYVEQDEKSNYVKKIYERFYKLIQLMELITQAHLDSLYPDDNDVDNALFQLILLHVLFDEDYMDERFVDLLSWLFQTLSIYGSIEKIEDINIEIKHIEWLEKLSKNVEKLCKTKSDQNVNDYKYLHISICTISQEMKLIYLQKSIKILSEKYSDAKWLEIIIYFPEYFQTNIDEIFPLLHSEEVNQIQKIIFERVRCSQNTKLEKFYELIKPEKINNHVEFQNQLANRFQEFNGYLNSSSSFENTSPYHALSLNSLIDTFNDRLELDNGFLIKEEIFIKIQECLCCFIDLRLVIE